MDVGYKIAMGVLKSKLVGQQMNDLRVKYLQAGFTEGRRMQENIFILLYLVEESYRDGRELVVVSVDFSKAFDSVERGGLVEALMYYKCDLRLIDVVAELYWKDKTVIFREGKELGVVEINCGIRQGCTVSPQLFIMVVGLLIERIIQSGMGYESFLMRVPVLFYADDGLMFARSRKEAEAMWKCLGKIMV